MRGDGDQTFARTTPGEAGAGLKRDVLVSCQAICAGAASSASGDLQDQSPIGRRVAVKETDHGGDKKAGHCARRRRDEHTLVPNAGSEAEERDYDADEAGSTTVVPPNPLQRPH